MSNRVCIQRRKVELIKSGEVSLEALMFESAGSGALDSMTFESLPDSDIDLLEMVMTEEKNMSTSMAIGGLLDYMFERQKGIDIDGTWYDWEEIKYLFDKIWVTAEDL